MIDEMRNAMPAMRGLHPPSLSPLMGFLQSYGGFRLAAQIHRLGGLPLSLEPATPRDPGCDSVLHVQSLLATNSQVKLLRLSHSFLYSPELTAGRFEAEISVPALLLSAILWGLISSISPISLGNDI